MADIDLGLLEERILKKYQEGRLAPEVFTLGRAWTPEQIVDAVRRRTPEGMEFLMKEEKIRKEFLKRM